MAGLRDRFVALLMSQAGYHEGRDADGTWNNHQRFSAETPGLEWSQNQPWCATFQAWAAHQLAADALWPMTAGCLDAVAWWKARGRWSSYPVLGGPFYLGPGGGTHTGVVYRYDADTIYTVEGNSNPGGSANGDGVYLRERPRRGTGSPYGYGVPAWPEGTISADPKLGGTTTAATARVADPLEEDPLAAYTRAELLDIVTEAASSVTVRDANAYAMFWWLGQALDGTVPDGAGAGWAGLLGKVGTALNSLPDDARQTVRDAVTAALADSTVRVHVDVTTPTTKES